MMSEQIRLKRGDEGWKLKRYRVSLSLLCVESIWCVGMKLLSIKMITFSSSGELLESSVKVQLVKWSLMK